MAAISISGPSSAACLRKTSVARMASGESRKIGAVGISPRCIRSTRSTISSWVRSTAKAGMSRAPSAALRLANFGRQIVAPRLRRDRWPLPVAVGGFRNDVIESRGRFRRGLQQLGVGADIAGSENPQRLSGFAFVRKLQARWRRSREDGRRSSSGRGCPVGSRPIAGIRPPGKSSERREGVGLGVDRRDRGAASRGVASIESLDLAFLDAAGVGQHVGAQVDGAARRENPAR